MHNGERKDSRAHMSEAGNNNARKDVSQHILPTAANLLGLCFVILSFIRVMKLAAETVIDELMGAAIIVFLITSVFSYASIRSNERTDHFEKIADTVFLVGLGLLTITAMIIVFEIL